MSEESNGGKGGESEGSIRFTVCDCNWNINHFCIAVSLQFLRLPIDRSMEHIGFPFGRYPSLWRGQEANVGTVCARSL